jgi:hypothetical protein
MSEGGHVPFGIFDQEPFGISFALEVLETLKQSICD